MRRLLYVTGYYPPAGGASVRRVLETVTNLLELGWRATVVTTDAPTDIHRDATLAAPDAIRVVRVRSQLHFLRRPRGASPDAAPSAPPSWKARLRAWLIHELLVPDSEAPWVFPAARAIRRELATGAYEAVVSTSPLPSSHVAVRLALGARGRHRFPWIADLRDPWVEDSGRTRATRSHAALDRVLERACVTHADALVTVNEPLRRLYRERYRALRDRPFEVVRNGFDARLYEEPLAPLPEGLALDGTRFDIVNTGRFYPEATPEQGLLEAVATLAREDARFARDARLVLIGPRDPAYEPDLSRAGIEVVRWPPVPHVAAISAQRRAALLILFGGSARFATSTSLKVYEYLASRTPMLVQASRGGELERFVSGRRGVTLAATEEGAAPLVRGLRARYAEWCEGKRAPLPRDPSLAELTWGAQVALLARLLDQMTSRTSSNASA